jgi:O-antigen ligase/Tfp pilus assembly protein PilF
MKNKLDRKNFWRRIYLSVFFLILALPLLNLPPWFSPPAWGKTIVFRSILCLIGLIFIWQILFRPEKQGFFLNKKAKMVVFSLIALWFVFLLSTLFSLDLRFSFWGSPYRSWGFLNFSFFILFAFLLFRIIKDEDWPKIWDWAIGVAVLVALFAVIQKYDYAFLKNNFIITHSGRTPSTIGSPLFLALYLLLFVFISLVLALKEQRLIKKTFYLFAFFLFLIVIFVLTLSRTALVGFIVGGLYFVIFYPTKSRLIKTSLLIGALVLLTTTIYLILHPNLMPQDWKRFSIQEILRDPRIAGWKITLQAITDRPILGYGPYNFSIAFDKHYGFAISESDQTFYQQTHWWDTAHNFYLDAIINTGFLGFISYLFFLTALFCNLQKQRKKTNNPLVYHGAQATLLSCLSALFFTFNTFSTYLIFFLLIGYCLHLINQEDESSEMIRNPLTKLSKQNKKALILICLILFSWFVYSANFKPLKINSRMVWASHYLKKGDCNRALTVMEKILPSHSFLDHYLRLNYIDIIGACIQKMPDQKIDLAQKAIQILKENTKLRPYYTRNWLFLGAYYNILLANTNNPEEQNILKAQAEQYLKKANQLGPNRHEIFLEWGQTYFFAKEYEPAMAKIQRCLEINPLAGACWWYKALIEIFTGKTEQAEKSLKAAKEKGYPVNQEKPLLQLVKAYSEIQRYDRLAEIYEKLVKNHPTNAQYRASLAYVYKILGQYDKAREQAERVLKYSPESKPNVEQFLKSLEQ